MKRTDEQISLYVWRRLKQFSEHPDDGGTKAALANLRRGVGKRPGDIPELWGYFLCDLPQELQGKNEPSYAEWAIYISLTVFAVHQQGHMLRTEFMNQEGQSLGKAMRLMVQSMEGDTESCEERVRFRLNQMATSMGMKELSVHLRSIVKLLSGSNIKLDYPMLAKELYWFQIPRKKSDVCLKWGRDFYTYSEVKNEKENREE